MRKGDREAGSPLVVDDSEAPIMEVCDIQKRPRVCWITSKASDAREWPRPFIVVPQFDRAVPFSEYRAAARYLDVGTRPDRESGMKTPDELERLSADIGDRVVEPKRCLAGSQLDPSLDPKRCDYPVADESDGMVAIAF